MMPVSPGPDTCRGDRQHFLRVDQSVSENEWTVVVTLFRSRWHRRSRHTSVSQACQFNVGIKRHVFVNPIIYARAQDNFEWSCTVCTSVRAIGGQEFSPDILIHSQSGYGAYEVLITTRDFVAPLASNRTAKCRRNVRNRRNVNAVGRPWRRSRQLGDLLRQRLRNLELLGRDDGELVWPVTTEKSRPIVTAARNQYLGYGNNNNRGKRTSQISSPKGKLRLAGSINFRSMRIRIEPESCDAAGSLRMRPRK